MGTPMGEAAVTNCKGVVDHLALQFNGSLIPHTEPPRCLRD